MSNLETAQSVDIQSYRAWFEKRVPIDRKEGEYLIREKDLITLTPLGSRPIEQKMDQKTEESLAEMPEQIIADSEDVPSDLFVQLAPLILPMILLLPILAFAIIPNLAGRLLVTIIIAAVHIAITISSGVYGILSPREWMLSASM
jgi:hypothetical protein